MRKIVTAVIAAVWIAATAMASSNAVQARWGGGGWHGGAGFGGGGWRGGPAMGGWRGAPGFGGGWHGGGGWYPGLGVVAGVATGAVLGGYYPYGYGVTPGYGYGGAAFYGYGDGGCYLTQQWGPYGPYMAQVCY
jgi:hypothetical protein